MPEPVSKYLSAIDGLPAVAERFRKVMIESKPALEVLKKYDSDDALFYCDPPYPHDTLASAKQPLYAFTMTDDDHAELLGMLNTLKAKVVLSGYSTEVYESHLAEWKKTEKQTHVQFSNSGGQRVEATWRNF